MPYLASTNKPKMARLVTMHNQKRKIKKRNKNDSNETRTIC